MIGKQHDSNKAGKGKIVEGFIGEKLQVQVIFTGIRNGFSCRSARKLIKIQQCHAHDFSEGYRGNREERSTIPKGNFSNNRCAYQGNQDA